MYSKKHIRNFNNHKEDYLLDINEAVKLNRWELNSRIDRLINSNMKEIPFEGTEVDKYGLRSDILELIYELCPEYKPID